jgi:biotin carboxyl carrier protein
MEEHDDSLNGEYPMLLTSSGQYKTTLTKKFENRKRWTKPDPLMIYAIIPGTIIDVYVKNGQKVKKGETILVLEAMKMQNQILMPFDGKIKKVHIQPDEKIAKHHLMIELA